MTLSEPYCNQDFGNGKEPKKLVAQNKYNFEQIGQFEYTPILESNGLTFTAPKGCECLEGNCAECHCDGKTTHFCNNLCSCEMQNCQKRYSPSTSSFQVFYANPQKKWGLRALEDIKQGEILFEYTGVLMRDSGEDIKDDDYILQFEFGDEKYMINAHAKGNLSRFINHSCSPNCSTKTSTIYSDGGPHVLIMASQKIGKGEELTLDYGDYWWQAKMDREDGIPSCVCQSGKCRYATAPEAEVSPIVANNHIMRTAAKTANGFPRMRQTATKCASRVVPLRQLATKCVGMGNNLPQPQTARRTGTVVGIENLPRPQIASRTGTANGHSTMHQGNLASTSNPMPVMPSSDGTSTEDDDDIQIIEEGS